MRLPNESREALEDEHVAWNLLAPWVKPDQATIVRHKVYTFRSLLANTWRKGRMLIAGDAAHVMPPFMGQGMCAGLRDDWNLASKLNKVLDGKADDSLLDTYQPERRPHVSDVIDLSMYLGKIICIPDAAKAAERDASFFGGSAAPPPAFPSLTDGILRRDAAGKVQAPAGLLSPHGRVRRGVIEGRFDDVVGLGFVLVSRTPAIDAVLGAAQSDFLNMLGAKRVVISAAGTATGPNEWVDLDGKFIAYMDAHGIDAMLVRPDFYLYGAALQSDDLDRLVDDLAADLQRHGVKLSGAQQHAQAVASQGARSARRPQHHTTPGARPMNHPD